MSLPERINLIVGSSVVSARLCGGRYFVYCGGLLWNDKTKDSKLFREWLDCLQEATGYQPRTQETLAGELMGDWEPAHCFVALNMIGAKRAFKKNDDSFYWMPRRPEELLWDLMVMTASDRNESRRLRQSHSASK
jgi:hypothetical protein